MYAFIREQILKTARDGVYVSFKFRCSVSSTVHYSVVEP
jgi:hypothetical protein